jgi:hypothetical protein
MLVVVHIQKPIPYWYDCNLTILHLCQCLNMVLSFFMDDLCHKGPFAFSRVLSIAVIEESARPPVTNRYPIVDILSFYL